MSNNDRIKKVDVENLSDDQFDQVTKALKEKVVDIIKENKPTLDEVAGELNKYLNVYGLKAELGYNIVKNEQQNKES